MPTPSPRFSLTVWLVHLLTATGAVWALLAAVAAIEGDARTMFLWLAIALLVDGIDGPLARWAKVKTRVPHFDGAALDLIVDFLTYVFVPVLFIWHLDLLPQPLELIGCGMILLSSLHLFAKLDMKSADNHFVGFPAVWNVAVLYLFLLDAGSWLNAAIVFALVALTFAPVKAVHPFRVVRLRAVTISATLVWFIGAAGLVWAYPAAPLWAGTAFIASSLWFLGVSAWATFRR